MLSVCLVPGFACLREATVLSATGSEPGTPNTSAARASELRPLSDRAESDGCAGERFRPRSLSPGLSLQPRELHGSPRLAPETPTPPCGQLYGLWRVLSRCQSFVREAGARRVSQRPPLRFGTRRPHHSPDLQPLCLCPVSGDLLGGVRLLHGCAPVSLMSSNLDEGGSLVK